MWQSWLQIGKPANDEGERQRQRGRGWEEGGREVETQWSLSRSWLRLEKSFTDCVDNDFRMLYGIYSCFCSKNGLFCYRLSIIYALILVCMPYATLYTLLYSIASNYSLLIKKANSVVIYRLFIDTKYAWICLVFNPIAWLSQLNHYAQLRLQVLALKCWWPIDCLTGMSRGRCLCFQGILS